MSPLKWYFTPFGRHQCSEALRQVEGVFYRSSLGWSELTLCQNRPRELVDGLQMNLIPLTAGGVTYLHLLKGGVKDSDKLCPHMT